MENKNEEFLKIVEEAENITKTISKLQKEIASYESAGQNLEQVRIDLVKYLETAQKASVSMMGLTENFNDRIDEILANTSIIRNTNEERFIEISKIADELIINAKQDLSIIKKGTSSLKMMVIISIAISLMAILVRFVI